MEEKIWERLVSFGYPVPTEEEAGGNIRYIPSAEDSMMIGFIMEKTVSKLKSDCNCDQIPEELEALIVDNIVGEFLLSKKNLGKLSMNDIDYTEVVQNLKLGDTTVEFGDGYSPAEMLDSLIAYLLKPIDVSDYRRIRW